VNNNRIIKNDRTFNIDLWRHILRETASKIGGKENHLEVINPFGFEITQDKSFLQRNLKRFFCYIGAANQFNYPSDRLVQDFFDELYSRLKAVDPQFASEIALFIIESDTHLRHSLKPFGYQPQWNDRVIIFEHRTFQTDILTDYSDYLIAVLWGFQENSLPELTRFQDSEAVRSRIFQLYLILECLFSTYAEPMTSREREFYKSIYNMKAVNLDYYFRGKTVLKPTKEDEKKFENVRLRLQKLFNEVKKRSINLISKNVKSYNSQDILHFEIDLEIYTKTISKIKKSYLSFQN
jgi:hypothetical protein